MCLPHRLPFYFRIHHALVWLAWTLVLLSPVLGMFVGASAYTPFGAGDPHIMAQFIGRGVFLTSWIPAVFGLYIWFTAHTLRPYLTIGGERVGRLEEVVLLLPVLTIPLSWLLAWHATSPKICC